MKNKHNPFVSIVALLLLVTILVLTCTGCHEVAADEKLHRFTCEWAGPGPSTHDGIYIITDTWTGVQYLTNGAGLTVLQPGEG